MKSIAGALFGFRCFDSLDSAARVDRRGDIPGHFKIGHQLQHPAMKMGSALLALMCGTMLTSTGHAVPQSDDHVLQPAGGDQLPGLTSEEVARFEAGRISYATAFDVKNGLGPIFNGKSCAACHGAEGGSLGTVVTQFGQMINGVFDPMEEFGGLLFMNPVCFERYHNQKNNHGITVKSLHFNLLQTESSLLSLWFIYCGS